MLNLSLFPLTKYTVVEVRFSTRFSEEKICEGEERTLLAGSLCGFPSRISDVKMVVREVIRYSKCLSDPPALVGG